MALANERFPVKSFPTPIIGDVLFWTLSDETLPRLKGRDYGLKYADSPHHPDAQRFPNHELVAIVPAVEEAGKYKWYWAARREDQDLYNWEFTEADIGGTKFPAVQRTYVVHRDDWDSTSPAMGTLMENLPVDTFPDTYVLAQRQQIRSPEKELDSRFVFENRVYVQRCTISEIRYDEATGRGDQDFTTLYYRGESVGGSTVETLFDTPTDAYWGLQTDGTIRTGEQLSENWFAIKTGSVIPPDAVNGSGNAAKARIVDRVTPTGTDLIIMETGSMPNPVPAYDSAHYDTSTYSGYKLSYIEPADKSGLLFHFYYVKARSGEDAYNWEFSDADIGGVKFPSVQRTYVTLRSAFNSTTPAQGAAMPNTPSALFDYANFVLAERKQTRTNDPKIDNLFVIDTLIYVKRCTINEIGVDPLNGDTLKSWTNLYYATEVVSGGLTAAQLFAAPTNAFWGLQANGTQVSGKQISAAWYLVETAQVVGGTMVDGVLSVQTYTSNDDYYWPPVLDEYELLDWERNDGGFDRFPAIRFAPEGYRGPCLTTVERTWSTEPFTIAAVEPMQPTRVYYASPFFTLNIPECLHPQIEAECDIGNTDTVYAENVGSKRYFTATNHTTWPATIVAYDDQEPFRGGYLRTVKTVARPTIQTQVGWSTGV